MLGAFATHLYRPRQTADARAARHALAALACLAAVLAATVWLPAPAAAARRPGRRVTVALFGDSVTESVLVPNFVENGLAPQLSRAESAFGFTPGGAGLIPAAPFRWHYNHWVAIGSGPQPTKGWLMIGYGLAAALDGPSEYSAVAISPQATATTTVSDPDVKVLYSSTNEQNCPFTVTAAGHTWSIDPYQPGPPTDTSTALVLPAGRHTMTVRGPSCGALWFDGIVAERPPPPGKVQLEVDNLGHSGKLPADGFTPRVQQSLAEQRYDISVFLYGYIAEVENLTSNYVSAMTERAHIARENGGACLIVAPAPLPVRKSTITQVAGLDRTVARREGCTYTTALTHLWSSPAAGERRGLVLIDGVHPTTAGYKLIAHTLAPIVAGMVRARLHGGG